MTQLSKLNFYSIGTVAVNKPLNTRDIEVLPDEVAPMTSGEVTDNAVAYKASGEDGDGAAYNVDVTTTSTIKATWLPIGSSNRTTAPDVRRGEKVVIYRFSDADEFWWATLKDDAHLRKLETVIYAFSGTTDESAKPDATNTYFFEVSTHQKLVHFHTSKANGEPFAYDLQINTGDGCITIQDDAGNYFVLNSRDTDLEFKNVDGSRIDINKKQIFIESPESISIQSKSINILGGETTIQTTAYTLNCSSSNSAGGSFKTAGMFEHNGQMVVNGKLNAAGGFSTSGASTGMVGVGMASGGSGGAVAFNATSPATVTGGQSRTSKKFDPNNTTAKSVENGNYSVAFQTPGKTYPPAAGEKDDPILDIDIASRVVKILAKEVTTETPISSSLVTAYSINTSTYSEIGTTGSYNYSDSLTFRGKTLNQVYSGTISTNANSFFQNASVASFQISNSWLYGNLTVTGGISAQGNVTSSNKILTGADPSQDLYTVSQSVKSMSSTISSVQGDVNGINSSISDILARLSALDGK